ncbi:hypothetical protein BDU57DRAFT_536249 [Ampelomyces quisqualis]|uniref:Uncharacterized protein n=1 Tax=Ampelomyces quisqualis TaxID=50730 RepID=A0A6A5QWE2_AMPQU|nr:hypothetical protein BDU57DRAFT_536249 [Ampelomyces quisqualis]
MTLEVYYGGNTFMVECNKSNNTNPINIMSKHQYAADEGMEFSTSVRFRLELRINVSFESLDYLRERLETPWLASQLIFSARDASHQWGYLLMDPMQDGWKQTAKWQHFFRRILHLRIVRSGDYAKNEICFKKGKMPKYLEELSQLWSPLCTQELEIQLRGVRRKLLSLMREGVIRWFVYQPDKA